MTEPQYLKSFAESIGSRPVVLRTVGHGPDPLDIVEDAISRRDEARRQAKRAGDENIAFDEIWAVFDRDSHARFEQACQLAKREGVHLAISNPCFELWILLHFAHCGGHVTCDQVIKRVEEHLPGYAKSINFDEVADGYADAVQLALNLLKERARSGNPGGNPSTTVHELTQRIEALGREARLKARKR